MTEAPVIRDAGTPAITLAHPAFVFALALLLANEFNSPRDPTTPNHGPPA